MIIHHIKVKEEDPRVKRLRKLRKLRGLALLAGFSSLSHMLREIGISYNHLWEVLRGNRKLSQRTRKKFVDLLGPEVLEVFINGDDED